MAHLGGQMNFGETMPMSDTYIQAHFHLVWAVKYRAALIAPSWKDRLHHYSIGLIEEHGHKVLAFNTMPDHAHLLLGYNINETIPRLMQHLKRDTSRWINQQGFVRHTFAWQPGYAGFAVEPARIPVVARYIRNQEQHHRKQRFTEEVEVWMHLEGMDYDPRYGFREPE